MEIYNNILNYNELSSTNEFAKELLKNGKPQEFSVVRAINQLKGKGQAGNRWSSESGKNLTCSIIIYPKCIPIEEQFIISEIISIAIYTVINSLCENVSIKWPNDIYIGDKKVAGILIENSIFGDNIQNSIIGIGLNINQCNFESWIPNPTSLFLETNKEYIIEDILQLVITEFVNLYNSMQYNSQVIHTTYLSKIYKFKQQITCKDIHGIFKGIIYNIDKDGKLYIIDESNTTRTYYFKEVEFII